MIFRKIDDYKLVIEHRESALSAESELEAEIFLMLAIIS
jgi:hypothetical protein